MSRNELSSAERGQFEDLGYLVVDGFLPTEEILQLREALLLAIEREEEEYTATVGSGATDVRVDRNMVHNCFIYSEKLFEVLNVPLLRACTDALLCRNAIVYAYQSSSAPPYQSNYGRRIHVDAPRFIPGYRTNLGFILALDDFTPENGATEVLPRSHRESAAPSEADFESRMKQLLCSRGDAIFFDARLWHRTGLNRIAEWRHALTVNFCRPYMRTRFDFPKMIAQSGLVEPPSSEARRYLGYDVRMPSSVAEFYLPPDQRLYKPNQE